MKAGHTDLQIYSSFCFKNMKSDKKVTFYVYKLWNIDSIKAGLIKQFLQGNNLLK